MLVRPAKPDDAERLEYFTCCGDLHGYERVVEIGLRNSLDWQKTGADHRVTLLVDEEDDDSVVAAARYRPFYPGHVSFGWNLELLAVRFDRQCEGLAFEFASAILRNLASDSPGGLCGWFVHEDNAASLRLSEKLNAVEQFVIEPPPNHVARVVRIPMTTSPS